MAFVTDIRTNAPVNTGGFFKSIAEGFARRKVYRETLRELNALDHRDLSDLGISRSEIVYLAREAAYGTK